YTNKYVELYNPTDADIPLTGLSLQYRSATNTSTGTPFALTGTVPAKGYYTVVGGTNGANGTAVPGGDQTAGINPSGSAGTIFLATGTAGVNPTATPGSVVDLLGYGSSNAFEGTAAGAASATTSLQRQATGGVVNKDSDVNSADFTALAPTPD